MVETTPTAYYSQQPQVQLENDQSQSGPVETEAEGARHISKAAVGNRSIMAALDVPVLFYTKSTHLHYPPSLHAQWRTSRRNLEKSGARI